MTRPTVGSPEWLDDCALSAIALAIRVLRRSPWGTFYAESQIERLEQRRHEMLRRKVMRR